MAWWGWLIVGSALLGAEMFVIDAQFYLVFLGIAALVVGLGALAGLASPEWAQWLAFAVLSVISMLAFRRRLYGMLRGSTGSIDERVTPGERIRRTGRARTGRDQPHRLSRHQLERAQHRRRCDRAR